MKDAFGHHSWATLRLLDACSGLTDEQLTQNVPGTYGSVIDTLRHLVESDAWYLYRLSEQRRGSTGLEEGVDVHGLRSVATANAAAWDELLGGDLDPERPFVSQTSDGETVHTYVGIRLAQALHHGTDHRSQVCTALTTLGIEPPEIDVWAYGESVGRMRVDPAPA